MWNEVTQNFFFASAGLVGTLAVWFGFLAWANRQLREKRGQKAAMRNEVRAPRENAVGSRSVGNAWPVDQEQLSDAAKGRDRENGTADDRKESAD